MKHEDDRYTRELPMPGAKRRPGRPAKPDALSGAERSRAYRLRKKQQPNPQSPAAPISLFTYEGMVRRLNHYEKRQHELVLQLNAARVERDELQRENARLLDLVNDLRAQTCQGVGAARSPQGEDSAP